MAESHRPFYEINYPCGPFFKSRKSDPFRVFVRYMKKGSPYPLNPFFNPDDLQNNLYIAVFNWYNYCMIKKLLRKHWPLVGIGGVLIVVCLYLVGANGSINQEPSLMDNAPEEGLKLRDIHYTQNNPDDHLRWTLDAKEVRFSQDRQRLSFLGFLFKLEAPDRPSVTLEGKRGEYNKSSGKMDLQGDLRGYTDNGYSFITERIFFNQKERILKTEEPVKIIGPAITVSGIGLYINFEEEILRILSGVTTEIGRGVFIL